MRQLKAGVLISYDYQLLKYSLPCYYPYVDSVSLAIDLDRKTWSGESFTIDESFFDWLKKTDTEKKIRIYEDNFHLPELTTLENDSHERTLLGKFMGEGGWHIQIDADEYFLDFPEFVKALREVEREQTNDITVYLRWITLFKHCYNGFLYIDANESFPIATTQPEYIAARVTSVDNKTVINQKVLHQSWARSENEVWQKINSWGHNKDFEPEKYFNFWKSINESNYEDACNFHPLTPSVWPKLNYSKASNIDDLIVSIKDRKNPASRNGLINKLTKKIHGLLFKKSE